MGDVSQSGLDEDSTQPPEGNKEMTILIISIVAAWIIFSALLVTTICINSARLSKIENHSRIPRTLNRMARNEQQRTEREGGNRCDGVAVG